MGFADKVKKGFDNATRLGTPELDKNRQEEKLNECGREMEAMKTDIGNSIFVSYTRGEQIEERYTHQCEKIRALLEQMNDINSRRSRGDYSIPEISDNNTSGSGDAGIGSGDAGIR